MRLIVCQLMATGLHNISRFLIKYMNTITRDSLVYNARDCQFGNQYGTFCEQSLGGNPAPYGKVSLANVD